MMNIRKERKMRHIAVSVLSLLVVLPAFADARLPVVNVASAGISARAAFGEPIVQTHKTVEKASVNIADNSTKSVTEPVNANAKVVARSAAPVVQTASAKNTSADAGGQIIAANDVLMPRRPSDDLWAKNTSASDVVPLRLPTPDEFSVIRSDAALPEESLNDSAPVTYAQTRTTSVAPVAAATAPLSELDAQIARLNELQRRADESVNTDFARVAVDKPALTERAPSAARRETRGVVARPSVARTASAEPAAKIAGGVGRLNLPMPLPLSVPVCGKTERRNIYTAITPAAGQSIPRRGWRFARFSDKFCQNLNKNLFFRL